MNINEAISHILDSSDEDVENKVLSGVESDHYLDDSTSESSTPSSSQEYAGNEVGLVSQSVPIHIRKTNRTESSNIYSGHEKEFCRKVLFSTLCSQALYH